MRLLFDQAYKMRPSIIFFDEIDGLAPVRSSRQDQIHSSIVSTLLALMDGLDKREQVKFILILMTTVGDTDTDKNYWCYDHGYTYAVYACAGAPHGYILNTCDSFVTNETNLRSTNWFEFNILISQANMTR